MGVLSIALGLTVTPAGASGEHTTAVLTSPLSGSSTTFTWSYEFHGNAGHSLSNVAISFCSTDILPHVVSSSPSGESFLIGDVPGGHTGFGPGIKFATTAVNGTLTVVFDQPQTAGGTINIQSPSGDGQAGDQIIGVRARQLQPDHHHDGSGNHVDGPGHHDHRPRHRDHREGDNDHAAVHHDNDRAGDDDDRRAGDHQHDARDHDRSRHHQHLGSHQRFSADDPAAGLAKTGFSGGPLVAFGLIALLLGAALVVGGKLAPAGD